MSDLKPASARILHVDDDEDVLAEVSEFLRDEEIPDWGTPDIVSTTDFSDACLMLEQQRFDLVILDVRLGAHDKKEISVEDEAGVEVLAAIKQRRFVPVVFWTGLPGLVNHLNDPVVRSVEKTAQLPALLGAVRELFATRLPAVNRALMRLVEEEQRRYMWEFVVPRWTELSNTEDHAAVAYLLARRLGRSFSGPGIRRLAEDLGRGEIPIPPSGRIHAIEMYVMPPLEEEGAQSGDLLRGKIGNDDAWWLLLTPSCDLAHGKAKRVLLAFAESIETHPDVVEWRRGEGNSRARQKQAEAVAALVTQATGGQRDRWIFLPAALDVPDLVVDLQHLVTISRDDLAGLERVASIDSPFAEEAINRFGRYFGRVGTPDLDRDGIMNRLKDAHPAAESERAEHRSGDAPGPELVG